MEHTKNFLRIAAIVIVVIAFALFSSSGMLIALVGLLLILSGEYKVGILLLGLALALLLISSIFQDLLEFMDQKKRRRAI